MRTAVRTAAVIGIALFGLLTANITQAAEVPKAESPASIATTTEKHRQLIVWSSADRDVAIKTVFLYTRNAKKQGWMDEVTLLIWGPSGKLLVEDPELQKGLATLKEVGVELYACKACSDGLGVSDKLTKLGVIVEYTGPLLADAQKNGWHVLTF